MSGGRGARGGGRTLYAAGLDKAEVAAALAGLAGGSVAVSITGGRGVVTVRLRTLDTDRLDDALAGARSRIGPAAFSDRLGLCAHVLDRLRNRGETIGVIESCTGGLIGSMLTAVPGSSDAFAGGLVTYRNRLKHTLAGVPDRVLAGPGAVSATCAAAMAEGGMRALEADHTLAVTGVAGPGGGSVAKPVGTVFIALASAGRATDTRGFAFPGGRASVRRWSANTALALLRLRLDGVKMLLACEG